MPTTWRLCWFVVFESCSSRKVVTSIECTMQISEEVAIPVCIPACVSACFLRRRWAVKNGQPLRQSKFYFEHWRVLHCGDLYQNVCTAVFHFHSFLGVWWILQKWCLYLQLDLVRSYVWWSLIFAVPRYKTLVIAHYQERIASLCSFSYHLRVCAHVCADLYICMCVCAYLCSCVFACAYVREILCAFLRRAENLPGRAEGWWKSVERAVLPGQLVQHSLT